MIRLSIVIPVWNNWNFTHSCLVDLAKLSSDHEIIVVDNGSTDETAKSIKNFQDVVYIGLGENTGFAHACNYGYEKSNGNCVMFLNNDIRVKSNHKNWTDGIIEAAMDGGLVGPTGGLLDVNFNFVKETDKVLDGNFYMSGWNVTASRNTWRKLVLPEWTGPFSEEFGRAYFEDTDLGFRARELNIPFKIVNVPVIHFGKMTSKKLNTAMLYQSARSKFINKWKSRM